MKHARSSLASFLSFCLIVLSPGYGAHYAFANAVSGEAGKPVAVGAPAVPSAALDVNAGLNAQSSALGLGSAAALAPAQTPQTFSSPQELADWQAQNLAVLKEDIARRVEAAPGPNGQKLPRIAIVAAGRLPQGQVSAGSFLGEESAKSLTTRIYQALTNSVALNELEKTAEKLRVESLFGAVDNTGSPNVAREGAVDAGWESIPGTGLQKNCGTSLKAVGLGASALKADDADLVIAGGAESMTNFPGRVSDPKFREEFFILHYLPAKMAKAPWYDKIKLGSFFAWTWVKHKARLINFKPHYALAEGLKIAEHEMMETAEILARKYGISREDQDWFAYESQKRAIEAALRGDFADERIPYTTRKGKVVTLDQGIRIGKNSRSGFRKLETIYKKGENPDVFSPTVTAGNASQVSDGASGVILMREDTARQLGLVPLAYVTAVRDTGVDPKEMGLGPAYAIPMALKAAGLTLEDAQFVEINEAFAAQTLTVMKALGLSHDQVNPRGGAIAIGHPLAASGTRLTATSLSYAMSRGLTRWVVSLCIGGGEGIAAVFERDPNMISRSFKETLRLKLRARGVSEPVLDKLIATINGLPPIFQTTEQGHLQAYRSVWNFVANVNKLASNGGSSLDSYSADLESISYNYGLIFVDRYMDPAILSDLDRTLQSAYPDFKKVYEAEYGPGTYNIRGAMAHFAAISVYDWSKTGQTARMPKSLRTLFEPVHDLFNHALRLRDTLGSHASFSQRLGEVSEGPIEDLPENGALRERLEGVLDLVKRDMAVFGPNSKDFKFLKITVDEDGVATAVIHRAPVNAINLEMAQELERALNRLQENPRVKSVVFTGEGKAFIAGADINVIENIPTDKEGEQLSSRLQGIFNRIEDFPKPILMAVNGNALGGGAEFAAAGHARWASSLAEFAFPEVGLGVLPGAGGTQRAPRLMGLTTALTWMNSAKMVDAYSAAKAGFVDHMVEPANLLAEAQAEARRLARLSDQERAEWVRAHCTLSKPIRLTLLERVGVHFGLGMALGALIGAIAGLAVFWLIGGIHLLAFSAVYAAKFALWSAANYAFEKAAQMLSRSTRYKPFFYLPIAGVAIACAAPWIILAGLAAAGGALGYLLMPSNGWLIRRAVAQETIKVGKKEYLHNIMRIIDAALIGLKKGPQAGLKAEAKLFGQLAVRPLARMMTALALRKYGGGKVKGVDEVVARPVNGVAVIGAGVMGGGIAQLLAYMGVPVTVKEVMPEFLDRGMGRIRKLFQGLVKADKYSPEDVEKKMALVTGTVDEDELVRSNPSLVIEAIRENQAEKEELFARLNKKLPPETIFASNTSALSITALAHASGRPEKFIGLHFFNPPHKLPLVELVLPDTKDFTQAQLLEHQRTVATALAFLKKTGRMVIVVHDAPGFVVNRILVPYINEAIKLVEEGATIEQVDGVMKKIGLPMGPLELADMVGFPLGVEVGSYLERELPSMGKMSVLLPYLLKEGYSGKAAKQGFYQYKEVPNKKTGEPELVIAATNEAKVREALRALSSGKRRKISDQEIKERLLFLMANESARILEEGVVGSPKEIDIAMATGMGFPLSTGGLLRYVSGMGLSHVAQRLRYYAAHGGGKAFEPSGYLLKKLYEYDGYRGIYNEAQPQ